MLDVGTVHEQATRLGAVELAARLGFHVRGNRNRARGACPICATKNTQAFGIAAKNGTLIAHCFACGFAGDIIGLIGAVRGVSDFRSQLDATLELLSLAPIQDRPQEAEPESARIDTISFHNVVTALSDICRRYKPIGDVASYVKSRGLLEVAVQFGLFALPSRGQQREVITELFRTFEADTLVAAGVLYRNHEGRINHGTLSWSAHRLCIPWRSPAGKIETLQRRALGSREPKYIFPKGIRAMHPYGIEQLSEVPQDHPIAFVEGALDCLSLTIICRRLRYNIIPLALGGVGNWNPNWAQYCAGREVYLCLDADRAGDERMPELAMLVHQAGAAAIRWWRPERGKDWGDELLAGAA